MDSTIQDAIFNNIVSKFKMGVSQICKCNRTDSGIKYTDMVLQIADTNFILPEDSTELGLKFQRNLAGKHIQVAVYMADMIIEYISAIAVSSDLDAGLITRVFGMFIPTLHGNFEDHQQRLSTNLNRHISDIRFELAYLVRDVLTDNVRFELDTKLIKVRHITPPFATNINDIFPLLYNKLAEITLQRGIFVIFSTDHTTMPIINSDLEWIYRAQKGQYDYFLIGTVSLWIIGITACVLIIVAFMKGVYASCGSVVKILSKRKQENTA